MRRGIRCRLSILVTLTMLMAVGVGAEDAKETAAKNAEVDDGVDVYFRATDLSALAAQDIPTYIDAEPGESTKLERSFPDAPPQISHTTEDMLPITGSSNECLECHHPENVTEEDEVPVTESHFKKAQMVEGKPGEAMRLKVGSYLEGKDLSGARYNCTMCHAAQATNVDTPASTFPVTKAE